MARLYGNENVPLPVVQALRERGHDVLMIQETGNAGDAVTDAEVLRFATAEKRAVLTLSRKDFMRLHDQSPVHGGIIVCTFDPDLPGQAERIHQAIGADSDLEGRLLRVNRPR